MAAVGGVSNAVSVLGNKVIPPGPHTRHVDGALPENHPRREIPIVASVLHHLVAAVVVEQSLHGLNIAGIFGAEGVHGVVSYSVLYSCATSFS